MGGVLGERPQSGGVVADTIKRDELLTFLADWRLAESPGPRDTLREYAIQLERYQLLGEVYRLVRDWGKKK